jgi:multidrug efflux pump subunit AcrB
MLPLSTVVRLGDKTGTDVIQRFNLFRCAEISGAPAAGYSSGQALAAMERVAGEVLPDGYGFAWTGTAFQERQASGGQGLVFGLAIAFVFLLLAAQYNNWAIPLGVILGLPVAVAGGLAYVGWRGFANDTYVQIGIVTVLGCVAKTAILIVEFAKQKLDAGEDLDTATVEASRLRFRPILMTCSAFILGTVPLAKATGAGSAARQGMGTVIIGGMLAASVISVFVVPMLFAVIERAIARFGGGHEGTPAAGAAGAAGGHGGPPGSPGGGHGAGHGGGHA